LINTLLDTRMDMHLERLRESVTWSRQVAVETLANITAALAARGSAAELAATRQLALIVRRQAEVLALSDVFLALTVIFLACVGFAALMRRPAGGSGGAGTRDCGNPSVPSHISAIIDRQEVWAIGIPRFLWSAL